jgi:transposase
MSPECRADILRYFHVEKWPAGTIARHLHLHASTVKRVLHHEGIERPRIARRASAVDPYIPFIITQLEKYPDLRSTRIWSMVRERGYPGGKEHFRALIGQLRPRKPSEAFLRLTVLPGEQGQVDWAHFGHLTCDGATRPLMAFVMVLSHSRKLFLRFYRSSTTAIFLRAHVAAFQTFGGVPRCCLYDNLKSAVLERKGDAIRFNPQMLELAAHYRFEARPVGVRKGNEKGRVERAIRYVRDNFFAARLYTSLDELNAQAAAWCAGDADDRRHPDFTARTVREVFADEQALLLPLPEFPFDASERVVVAVGKTPYVRFDRNDYSVPHTCVRRLLTAEANETRVRLTLDGTLVAEHSRVYGARMRVETLAHTQELAKHKRAAREHRNHDRLHHAAPHVAAFIKKTALTGSPLGALVRHLHALLERFGGVALNTALETALLKNAVHIGAVRQLLDTLNVRREPPILIHLGDNARHLTVTPHRLDSYDTALIAMTTENHHEPD